MNAKKIVETYFDSLENGNFELLGQLFSEDIIWHQPGSGELSKTYHGKKELFDLFGQFMKISQGSFKIDQVKSIMVNRDLVSVSLHFSAAHSKGEISMDGIDLMKVVDGKIVEVWLFSENQETEDKFWVEE